MAGVEYSYRFMFRGSAAYWQEIHEENTMTGPGSPTAAALNHSPCWWWWKPLCDIKTMLNNHSVPACDCFNLHLRNTYPGLLTYLLLLYISANDRGVKTSHFFKLDSKCCALTTLCTWHRLVKVREGTRWTSLGVFIQISVLSHNKPGWKKSRCPGRKYPAVPDEQLNTLFNTVL